VVDTEFYVLDLRWDHRFGPASSVRLATTLGLETTGGDAADLELLSHRLRQRAELDHRISADTRVRGGADVGVEHFSTRLHGIDPNGIENDEGDDWQRLFPTRSDLTTGAWVELDQKLDPRTTLQPGLRLDYYYSDFAHALGVDPRLALRVAILPEVRLVPTVGIAHQPPSFLVPIPGFAIAGLPGGLQRSVQSSFGVEADLPFDLSGRVTVFNHALFNLSDPIALVRSGEGDLSFDRRVIGSSKGLEIFLRRPISHRIGGFLSYTLSRTTRSLGRETFAAAFDRTHVFNAAVSFDLGRRWRAGTRFVFYTGFPAIELGDADQRPANPGRTFPFYRLDARLEKRWIIADHGFVALVFEWLNATLRPEVVDVQCTDSGHCQPVTIGPVTIPSIGVEGGFF
jgi:hypothetical protein